MKKLLRHSLEITRIIVVLLAVISLTVSGAQSARRLFTGYGNHQAEERRMAELAQLIPGPPSPDEAPGQMARHSQPNCEQPAFAAAPLVVKTDNSENRLDPDINQPAEPCTLSEISVYNHAIKTSTSNISSSLAQQFTLVGAKPSGTS